MKRKNIHQPIASLRRRFECLDVRFLTKVPPDTDWEAAEDVDLAAAFVALLHAEIEATLEKLIRETLRYGVAQTERWKPHPVLVNCVMHYQGELHLRLNKVKICPPRAILDVDSAQLLNAWRTLGAGQYIEGILKGNHGAGIGYVESMLHPLGIVVSDKSFSKPSGMGVRPLGRLASSTQTELTEFVVLRGSAVHADSASFQGLVEAGDPEQIRKRGHAAVVFVESVGKVLHRSAL